MTAAGRNLSQLLQRSLKGRFGRSQPETQLLGKWTMMKLQRLKREAVNYLDGRKHVRLQDFFCEKQTSERDVVNA